MGLILVGCVTLEAFYLDDQQGLTKTKQVKGFLWNIHFEFRKDMKGVEITRPRLHTTCTKTGSKKTSTRQAQGVSPFSLLSYKMHGF